MKLAAFYHVFADGVWEEPLDEYLEALVVSGFAGPLTFGLVGRRARRDGALRQIRRTLNPDRVLGAEDGWEQFTLKRLWSYSKRNDGAVLYAHTKGAAFPSELNAAWRRSMTRHVLGGWRENLDSLESGEVDAIGCHWLTQDNHPEMSAPTPFPMFGGNFWMASCEYVRGLPACLMNSRYDAEAWVGLNSPRVLDLLPGWPSLSVFA